MKVLLLLLLLCTLVCGYGSGSTVCSSLDGPYCVAVNGLDIPPHGRRHAMLTDGIKVKEGTGVLSGLFEMLEPSQGSLKTVMETLVEQLTDNIDLEIKAATSKPYARGSYHVSGTYDPWTPPESAELKVNLWPGKWIQRPGPDWVTVGLSGVVYRRSNGKFEFVASLVDEKGEVLDGCSELVAVKVLSEEYEAKKWPDVVDNSLWKGKYTCSDLPTDMTLTLKRTKTNGNTLPAGELIGEFSFVVTASGVSLIDRTVLPTSTSPNKKMKTTLHRPKLTRAGCECLPTWSETIQLQDGTNQVVQVENGKCHNAKNRQHDYCYIRPGSCAKGKRPAGGTWDYCVKYWKLLHENPTLEAELASIAAGDIEEGDLKTLEIKLDLDTLPENIMDMLNEMLPEDTRIDLESLSASLDIPEDEDEDDDYYEEDDEEDDDEEENII